MRTLAVVVLASGVLVAGCSRSAEDREGIPGTGEVRPLLREVLDRQEIQELLSEYMRHLEARDWTRYAELFAGNGELHFNENHFVGSEVIRESMQKRAPANPAPAAADLLPNVSIDGNGNAATSTSRWTGIQLGPDKTPVVTRAGRYEDTLVRENGRWRFQKRIVHVDVTPPAP
jgi:hypothetical protein